MVESNGHRSTAAPVAVGFFRVPGLFVRLSSSKGGGGGGSNAVDADSVWSPTSPLDFKSVRSSPPRVGLGLVDALTADDETGCSMHFGARSSFLDSIKPFLDLALPPKAAAAVCGNKAAATAASSSAGGVAARVDKASEYADDCEEYTCVISRGANPRTTHILAGETVEVRNSKGGDVGGCRKVIFSIEPLSGQQRPSASSSPAATAGVASGRCCCCMKRLQENKDIFIYLGEKAFCSSECRTGYIEEEEVEEAEELMILDPALNL